MFGFGSSGVSFDPTTDIPDLKGKVIFVTGGKFAGQITTLSCIVQKEVEAFYFSGFTGKE